MRRRRSTTTFVPAILNCYLRVLSTYSGHRRLNDDTRELPFRGIANLIDNCFDGCIVKCYLTTLYVAKRK